MEAIQSCFSYHECPIYGVVFFFLFFFPLHCFSSCMFTEEQCNLLSLFADLLLSFHMNVNGHTKVRPMKHYKEWDVLSDFLPNY